MHLYDGGGKRLWERPGKDGRRNSTGAKLWWKKPRRAAAGRPGPRMETRREQEPQGKPARGMVAPPEMDAPVQTEPLLVYLNDFDGVIGDLFKEATGYDVEVVAGNGAETMSRIEAEKSNPQWDVVWIDSMYDVYKFVRGWKPADRLGAGECGKPDGVFQRTGAGQ